MNKILLSIITLLIFITCSTPSKILMPQKEDNKVIENTEAPQENKELESDSPLTDPNEIENTWVLSDPEKKSTQTIFITFKADDLNLKFNGFGGCNNIFGTASISKSKLKFTNIGRTRKACRSLNEENNIVQLLNETDGYIIKENTLYLFKKKLLLLRLVKR